MTKPIFLVLIYPNGGVEGYATGVPLLGEVRVADADLPRILRSIADAMDQGAGPLAAPAPEGASLSGAALGVEPATEDVAPASLESAMAPRFSARAAQVEEPDDDEDEEDELPDFRVPVKQGAAFPPLPRRSGG